jgi:beta-glucosidase
MAKSCHFPLVAAALALVLSCAAAIARPTAPDVEARVQDLLSRMTLEEKIGQLNLMSNEPGVTLPQVEAGRVGAVLAFTNGPEIVAVQAAARRSRLGIPLLVGLDVLHGFRTIFPIPLGEASSFDPDLARRAAAAAAREATSIGINWTFAPMADLARDPRWGRMVEGFGEDPYLGRVFTRARVEGFHQGGLATTLKHFAGYGAALGGRDYDAATIAPGDLFDAYLPPFRAGIEAGSESVMSAFLALNGTPVAIDSTLLTDVLRGRWGFDGFVVSDWNAVGELLEHGVAADPAEAARKALLAGIDMDMFSDFYARHLASEVKAGRVPEARVTEAAARVLRAKFRAGLFDRPWPETLPLDPAPPSAAIRAEARAVARDSMVLLRNEGALPIRGDARIAVVGGLADSARNLVGPHAALVRFDDAVPIVEALRRRVGRTGGTVAFAAGCDPACASEAGFAEAVEAARAADTIVAVLGETNEFSGESGSRAYLTLPGRQAQLLDALVATGKPVVVVLLAARPIELGPVVDRLAGLLMAWFPGTEGGEAVTDLLFGDADPAAKLPVTWPRTIGQVPLTYDAAPTGRPFKPDSTYVLRYVDESLDPLYPFGFGLTYTKTSFSDLKVATPSVSRSGALGLSVRVANTGTRAGREVAQLYVRQLVASESRPLRRLKAVQKVTLGPGEARVLTFQVPAAELGFHRRDGTYVVETGSYQVFVGSASDAPLQAFFQVVD